jgi:hypothetical protein
VNDLVTEIAGARVLAALHFLSPGIAGVKPGQKAASWMLRHYFRPVD